MLKLNKLYIVLLSLAFLTPAFSGEKKVVIKPNGQKVIVKSENQKRVYKTKSRSVIENGSNWSKIKDLFL